MASDTSGSTGIENGDIVVISKSIIFKRKPGYMTSKYVNGCRVTYISSDLVGNMKHVYVPAGEYEVEKDDRGNYILTGTRMISLFGYKTFFALAFRCDEDASIEDILHVEMDVQRRTKNLVFGRWVSVPKPLLSRLAKRINRILDKMLKDVPECYYYLDTELQLPVSGCKDIPL
ncbi:MAG: hypothetical protein A2583_12410 [Bdellovibrionales bacterium RIFOXYD1_FULL_53_11]|nr:MAG: hypothetical protein A2583_12410 [Bdellovibrionales bacterium RIFOXYD1_FULL_53_11]